MAAETLNFQDYSTVQSCLQPKPKTIAAANVIAPSGFLTILTGDVVIKTITPPMPSMHMIAILFAGVAGVDATGNVATLKASVAGEVMLLVFNPLDSQYYPVG